MAYAGPGMRLALTGRDRDRLEAVAHAAREQGAAVETGVLDVRDRDAMAGWIARADAVRPFDLVVANAGITTGLAPDDTPAAATSDAPTGPMMVDEEFKGTKQLILGSAGKNLAEFFCDPDGGFAGRERQRRQRERGRHAQESRRRVHDQARRSGSVRAASP